MKGFYNEAYTMMPLWSSKAQIPKPRSTTLCRAAAAFA